ncbi:GNAT family N-acetyltransferase [Mycolicibacterium flavescens]|uniref:GNAT family N-acetyltransferase n=1 Tax=Mycolicibacterium flavescens TaxID=1776 RepID=A0A1E3RBP2_MYCFV|nr:GNAT family N-acetyltransferase [Mycolicibacterium flavescens]MCV7279109.1 GNAT family N-acetyltransferase [Mycolicibacterium flavescens]ODQ86797.1 GNAT family N-acetyltransferase [Mycolicibacterium flavescens]
MQVRFHDSGDDFRAVAGPLYRRAPVANTVELTVLDTDDIPEDSLLLTLWKGSTLVGAALQTPPYPLACNNIPIAGVEAVAAAVAEARPQLPGVRGARDVALAFSTSWRERTGAEGVVALEECLYALADLHPPTTVAGAARIGDRRDRAVLIDWTERFFGETFGHPRDDAAGARFVDTARDRGDVYVVWDVDHAPVSTAVLRAAAAGVSRIGPVYTPEPHRRHGYGSAVTAAAAAIALDRGDDGVVLFTDLANPTSNAIYRRIGFRPVSECVRIDFRTPG